MDLTTISTASIKTPEPESETLTRIQTTKRLSSSNGVLKRHNPLYHHHNHSPQSVVTYKECLKNHAANLGSHAVDGCGEFMQSPTDPISLKCAACGCHRNFHRRDPEESSPPPNTTVFIEYQPQPHHHLHQPRPPLASRGCGNSSSPSSPSQPLISSSYYPSAPHMLLALSTGLSAPPSGSSPSSMPHTSAVNPSPNGRKRFRTKFTQNQKERMLEFADRLGWKTHKKDEESIAEFCNEVGVDKGVLRVWMHNNKNTSGKKDHHHQDANKTPEVAITNMNGFGDRTSLAAAAATHYSNDKDVGVNGNLSHHLNNDIIACSNHVVATTNGSSSSF